MLCTNLILEKKAKTGKETCSEIQTHIKCSEKQMSQPVLNISNETHYKLKKRIITKTDNYCKLAM